MNKIFIVLKRENFGNYEWKMISDKCPPVPRWQMLILSSKFLITFLTITPPDHIAHHTVTRWACKGFSIIAFGFPEAQMRQFCILTYPDNWKCALSEKMIFWEKPAGCSEQIYGDLNGRSASIAAPVESCKASKPNPFAKFAMLCFWIYPIVENVVKLITFDLLQHCGSRQRCFL